MRIADRTLALRYARALFECACARGEEAAVAGDLDACARSLGEALPFLRDPRVAAAEKRRLLRDSVGAGAAALTADFLDMLIEEKRLDLLPLVAQDCGKLLLRKRNLALARVRSARTLSEDERRRLRESLEAFAGCGVKLEVEEDPGLLGGVSVRLGDWVLDGSLSGQLARLREDIGGD